MGTEGLGCVEARGTAGKEEFAERRGTGMARDRREQRRKKEEEGKEKVEFRRSGGG